MEPPPDPEPLAWLAPACNCGHAYRDRVSEAASSIAAFYAARYRHSDRAEWSERLAAGQVWCNGRQLRADGPLQPGDRLVWHRPPWQEAAVPVLSPRSIVFDDGDLLVLNKPSGLPVLPAGGFLEHTLLLQLQGWAPAARPVHRLGRFTSGLLVCARRPASRAWLSARLRDSTRLAGAAGDDRPGPGPVDAAAVAAAAASADAVAGADAAAVADASVSPSADASADAPAALPPPGCRKLYRALSATLPADWALGESRSITMPIGRRPHPLLGEIWCAAPAGSGTAGLPACSQVTLLERRADGCLLEVAIASGRPHQIRIHTAALGAPLLGDPLYLPGGLARPEVLPGAAGYRLHAFRLHLPRPDGPPLQLQAPPPPELRLGLECEIGEGKE